MKIWIALRNRSKRTCGGYFEKEVKYRVTHIDNDYFYVGQDKFSRDDISTYTIGEIFGEYKRKGIEDEYD